MTLSGYDGSGCLRVEFDADKFEKDYKDKFVGGTYELNTGMTPTEIMQVLAQSDSKEE